MCTCSERLNRVEAELDYQRRHIAVLERTLAMLTGEMKDVEGLVYRIRNERRGVQIAMAVGE